MKQNLILLFGILHFTVQAQDCDCESNFNWMRKTFEENDAGYTYALSQKEDDAYQAHNEAFVTRVKQIDKMSDCRTTLYEWLQFFRKGHIAIRDTSTPSTSTANITQPTDDEIRGRYKEWERVEIDVKKFKKEVAKKKVTDYEGIWTFASYTVGIKKIGEWYVGFIIEADGIFWQKNQIKLRFQETEGSFEIKMYYRDHSLHEFDNLEMLGDNYMQMGESFMTRIYPELPKDDGIERYVLSSSASKPYFEEINENTLLLRIPSFSGSEKPVIDSVILNNKNRILRTTNLIIDIRNNGGGSGRSYKEILPLVYTNPFRSIGVEYLSTTLNNQRMLDFINDPEYGFDEEEKKWAKDSYDILSTKMGEFVNVDTMSVDIIQYDSIHSYPKNVGIIINGRNGSTAEQFLLDMKQSKKVKLFGTTTVGVLDISNMYFVKAPCGEFELGYSLTRSLRIPDMAIDGKGIMPDYYIDESIPDYKWIDFVTDVLNQKN